MWPTFILDLANNHGGKLEKAIEIVSETADVLDRHIVDAVFKLQYRDLERHKHGDDAYRDKFQNAYLSWGQFKQIVDYIHRRGYRTACTAFDPSAAEWMREGFQYAKVASCSAHDWETIEAIANLAMPTIFSTAGLSFDEIDDIVSYAEHRGLDYALMHCVAIYPSEPDELYLSRIAEMKRRYPTVTIGWSTHENPNLTGPVQMAYAYGARIFERHIGGVNAYSSTPLQLDRWLTAWKEAQDMGEFQGSTLGKERMALARVERKFDVDPGRQVHPLKKYVHRTKASLNIAGIPISPDFSVEFSHHYGLGLFETWGAVLITLVNRDYCKKIIVMQEGQSHPAHFHKIKEETFQVLHGKLLAVVEHRARELLPGDVITVLPGQWHSFMGMEDHTIFEEISTKSLPNDSVYRDPLVTKNTHRKTAVRNWGRFELA